VTISVVEADDSVDKGAVGTVKVEKDGERVLDVVGKAVTSVLELPPITGDTGVDEVLLKTGDVTTGMDDDSVGMVIIEIPEGKDRVEAEIHETVERFTEVKLDGIEVTGGIGTLEAEEETPGVELENVVVHVVLTLSMLLLLDPVIGLPGVDDMLDDPEDGDGDEIPEALNEVEVSVTPVGNGE
jgi:hypothetical protein